MAMQGKGQRAAVEAIARCRPFSSSTGNLRGTRGPAHQLGWLSAHPQRQHLQVLLSDAVYVVWSWETPIAFVHESEDGTRTAYYIDESHSPTTAHHQSLARQGMGEYETIGERARQTPMRRHRPSGDTSATGRPLETDWTELERAAQLMRERQSDAAFQRERMGAAYPDWERIGRERAELAASPGYTLGITEEQQAQTLKRLLDPRFRDADWTPFVREDQYGRTTNLPDGADDRDVERVEREGRWHL